MKKYSENDRLTKEREMVSPEKERLKMLREMVDSGILPITIACLRTGLSEKDFLEQSK